MIFLWLGVIAGLVFSYLVQYLDAAASAKRHRVRKVLRHMRRRYRSRHPSKDHRRRRFRQLWLKDRWAVGLGWALLGVAGLILLLAVLHGAYHASDQRGLLATAMRFTRGTIAPLVTGFLIGCGLFFVVGRLLRGNPLTGISVLGVVAVIGVLLARDPDLSFLGGLKSASIAGVSIELKPETPGPGSTSVNVLAHTKDAPGLPENIHYVLPQISNWLEYIERDLAYMKSSGLNSGLSNSSLVVETQFVKDVIMPTASRLRQLHNSRRFRNIGFVVDHAFVQDLRALVLVGHARHLASAGHADALGMYKQLMSRMLGDLDRLWTAMCAAEAPFALATQLGAQPARKARARSPCDDDHRKVKASAERILGDVEKKDGYLFAPDHLYGAVLSSFVLYMAQEEDAAIVDLHNYSAAAEQQFATAGGKQDYRLFGLYRAYFLYTHLLGRRAEAPTRRYAVLRILGRAIELADMALAGPGWRAASQRLADWKAKRDTWLSSERYQWCQAAFDHEFKTFFFSYVQVLNNYVHYGTVEYEALKRQGLVSNFIDRVSTLANAPLECLKTTWVSEDKIESLKLAILDTLIDAYIALSQDKDRPEAARKLAACAALDMADNATAVAAREANAFLRQPLSRDLDKLFEEAAATQVVVDVAAQHRQATQAVRQLIGADKC